MPLHLSNCTSEQFLAITCLFHAFRDQTKFAGSRIYQYFQCSLNAKKSQKYFNLSAMKIWIRFISIHPIPLVLWIFESGSFFWLISYSLNCNKIQEWAQVTAIFLYSFIFIDIPRNTNSKRIDKRRCHSCYEQFRVQFTWSMPWAVLRVSITYGCLHISFYLVENCYLHIFRVSMMKQARFYQLKDMCS